MACSAVSQRTLLAAKHFAVVDTRSNYRAVVHSGLERFHCALASDNAACVLYRILLHFLEPDIAEADIRRVAVMILADHAALPAEEVRVFVCAYRLGVAEGLFAAVLVLHGGKSAPVTTAVIQPLCALKGDLLLPQRN